MLNHRWILRFPIAIASCAVWTTLLTAQQSPSGPELTGNPWIDMDYGPSLTLTVEAGPDNLAYKGIAIRLDEGPGGISQGTEFAVFDTDTLRFAASWTGGQFIDWRCIHFNGEHEVHPRAAGAMLFENPPGPGWARPGTTSFEDERFVGRDGRRYGPLKREWAHWKGHYHHGNRVILSYNVGRTDVLELPAMQGDDTLRAFARTLNLGPRAHDVVVQIAHTPSAEIKEVESGENAQRPNYLMLVESDQQAASERDSALCIGLVGGPAGCEWITSDDGNVRLAIPRGDAAAHLKVVYARVDDVNPSDRFATLLAASAPPQDLEPLTHGGPPRWTEMVTTMPSVVGDADGPYVAEEITVPHDNPYRSWMRLGGFDFFAEGRRAAVCTWQGDVWIVDGIANGLGDDSTLSWRRIASGMFQPLGLKIVDGDIYVTCRDQITILRDVNGDGETDFYENFNNDTQVTDHFHEFAVGLQTDADGNFYYAKCARHALDAVQFRSFVAESSSSGSAKVIESPSGVACISTGTCTGFPV